MGKIIRIDIMNNFFFLYFLIHQKNTFIELTKYMFIFLAKTKKISTVKIFPFEKNMIDLR